MLTTDPVNSFFSVQSGEQRHRGLELEVRGKVTPSLNLVASYSYIDPKITRANDGTQGKNPVNVLLPSFTALDGGIFYRTGPWRFVLNLRSLTDKNFVLLCSGLNQCEYGEKRSGLLTASYAF